MELRHTWLDVYGSKRRPGCIQSLQLLYWYILISHLVTVPFKVRAWISWPGTIYCVRLRWTDEWADGRVMRTGWGEGTLCNSKGTLHEYNVITTHVHYYSITRPKRRICPTTNNCHMDHGCNVSKYVKLLHVFNSTTTSSSFAPLDHSIRLRWWRIRWENDLIENQ